MRELNRRVIGAAIEVHRLLGPGLLEAMYQQCLVWELEERGLSVDTERVVPVTYKGRLLDKVYRLDLVVEGALVVEVKSVIQIDPIFTCQLKTYLRLTEIEEGLLLNFNVPLLKDGLRQVRAPKLSKRFGATLPPAPPP